MNTLYLILIGASILILIGSIFLIKFLTLPKLVLELEDIVSYSINSTEVTCIGKNMNFTEMVLNLRIKPLDNKTKEEHLSPIENITSIEIFNEANGGNYSLKECKAFLSELKIKCIIPKQIKFFPGIFHVRVPKEIKTGTNSSVLIKSFKSKNTFRVTKKNYQRIKNKEIKENIYFKKRDTESILKINLGETLIEVPKLILNKKEIKCEINPSNNLLMCHISKEDFPPSISGNKYEGAFYNPCEEIEAKISINVIEDLKGEKKEKIMQIIIVILPFIIFIGVGGFWYYHKKNN